MCVAVNAGEKARWEMAAWLQFMAMAHLPCCPRLRPSRKRRRRYHPLALRSELSFRPHLTSLWQGCSEAGDELLRTQTPLSLSSVSLDGPVTGKSSAGEFGAKPGSC